MKKLTLIIFLFLFSNSFSQSIIITKKGDSIKYINGFEHINQRKKQFFYYTEMPSKQELKPKLYGIGMGKLNKKYGKTIAIEQIDKILSPGVLQNTGKNKFVNIPVEVVKIIKIKNRYTSVYALTEGEFTLYLCPNCGNNEYLRYYVKRDGENLKKIDANGTVLAANFWKKLKKEFSDCQKTVEYISTLKKDKSKKYETHEYLIDIVDFYNNNCSAK
ncbi:hypothetical protein H7F37_03835 [Winogradskyella sp. PAMC22761]|nr:hypothetical protein H7F37_03835 [Winogradskyella sp. PAMC22761]